MIANKSINRKAQTISRLLVLLITLVFINNADYFIHVGVSIRPYYFVLLGLVFVMGRTSCSINQGCISCLSCFYMILITGLIGWLFYPQMTHFEVDINPIILLVLQFLTFLLSLIAFYRCDKELLFRGILKVVPLITIIPLFLYIYNFHSIIGVRNSHIAGIYTGHDGMPRLIGLFQDPNYFSLYMFSLLVIIVLFTILYNVKLTKMNIFFMCIGMIDIFLTFSRSAYVVVLLYAILFLFSRPNLKSFLILILLIICIFSVLYFLDESVVKTMMDRFEETGEDGSSQERILLLETGLLAPFYFPLGVGVGHCWDYYALTYMPKLAHNDFLTVLIECGLIGLLAYLFIWLKVFKVQNSLGRITVFSIAVMACTLSCYGYEPIIPILFSFFLVFNKYEKNISH